jgi:hypothetical protein
MPLTSESNAGISTNHNKTSSYKKMAIFMHMGLSWRNWAHEISRLQQLRKRNIKEKNRLLLLVDVFELKTLSLKHILKQT